MSHVPGNLIFKRWLNALKSPTGFVNPPAPAGSLTFFDAETISPVPPNTVMGNAATERDLFLTYITTDDPITFENKANNSPVGSWGPNAAGVSATMAPNGLATVNFGGRFNTNPVGGVRYVELGAQLAFVIDFSVDIAGFGTFLTDIGDFNAQWSVSMRDVNGVTTTRNITHTVGSPNGNLVFWGFIDSTGLLYNRVTISKDNTADAGGMDGVYMITPGELAV